MNGFLTMIKLNLKLLLRNKGYLAFLIILPTVSVIMLNVQISSGTEGDNDSYVIQELSSDDESILNVQNNKLSIKVYDCSDSKLSEYVLQELAKTGSYRIHRYKSEAMNIDEAREKARNAANRNVIGAVVYIPDNFEAGILNDNGSNITVFQGNDDARIKLLEANINSYLQSISSYAAITGYDKAKLESMLKTSVGNEIDKKVNSIQTGESLNLSTEQQNHSTSIGYSVAFLTIGFLFSGVFIAGTIIDERHNRVYNRVILSNASLLNYSLVKLVMILLTVSIQTGILAVLIKLFIKADFGIPYGSYLFFVFWFGLIFDTLSVVIGVITNNVLTSNYIAFLIWCLSNILAGLYFPLDAAAGWWSKVSLMMPQRWVIKASEMLMVGKSGVYGMYLLVVAGFLIIIGSVGFIGITIRRKE